MNAQLEDAGFACHSPRLVNSHIDRTRTVQDYYGPSAPVHLYREYINYWYRIRDVRTLCSWTEPHGLEDYVGRTYWQATRQVRLRTGVDNYLSMQFTLDELGAAFDTGRGPNSMRLTLTSIFCLHSSTACMPGARMTGRLAQCSDSGHAGSSRQRCIRSVEWNGYRWPSNIQCSISSAARVY